MDRFTEKLQFYINRKKVSLKKLSELTGLSRTTLKRYVEGVRVPKKEEYVSMIMEELSLSEEEKKELLEIYRRKLVGEKRYRIGKLVRDVQPDDDLLHKKEYVGLDVLEEAIQKVFQSGVNIQIVLNNSLDVIYDIFLKILRNDERREERFIEKVIFLNGIKDINDTVGIEKLNYEIAFLKLTDGGMTFYQYQENENPEPFGYVVSDHAVCYFFKNKNQNKISVYLMEEPGICKYYAETYVALRKKSYLYAKCETFVPEKDTTDEQSVSWTIEITGRKYARYRDEKAGKDILLYANEVVSLIEELEEKECRNYQKN